MRRHRRLSFASGAADDVLALLRYVPGTGMARPPARFAVLAVLGMSPTLRRSPCSKCVATTPNALAGAFLAVVLAIELLPMPRPLYSATVPDVYQLIATTGDKSGRMLELPTRIREALPLSATFGHHNTARSWPGPSRHDRILGTERQQSPHYSSPGDPGFARGPMSDQRGKERDTGTNQGVACVVAVVSPRPSA